MYELIKNMIDHEWVSNYSGDQQYIYYIVGAVIILFLIMTYDLIGRLIDSFRFK